MEKRNRWLPLLLLFMLAGLPLLLSGAPPASGGGVVRRVYVPYTSATSNISVPERGIFWFGEVGPTTQNYTDVRVIHNDDTLHITLHVFDQYLFVDETPSAGDLTQYDAVTVLLHKNGPAGGAPTAQSYQFAAALENTYTNQLPRDEFENGFQGNGTAWVPADLPFTTFVGTQTTNGYNNTAESDRGWNITFQIPYSTLGLGGKPAAGTTWGFGVMVHDRDDAGGSTLAQTRWPEGMNSGAPSSWGELVFDLPPAYTPPAGLDAGSSITIREGQNGAAVPDGHVGGSSNCGSASRPFWANWGSANYAGVEQVNIQNQWNLGDFPCFSKYYVTFPLDALPANQGIESATLRMHHFGNAYYQGAEPSLIQVMTVTEDWNEATINWNNAPLAGQLVDRSWVNPIPDNAPGQLITWDVSQAVADAYAAGQPLRLVLYSADNGMHSGKYFNSSEIWDPERRPSLFIDYGPVYGFAVTPRQMVATTAPGGSTDISFDLASSGGFNAAVSAGVNSIDSAINASFAVDSVVVNPSGSLTLNINHLHGAQTTGGLYAIPVTFTGDGIVRNVTVYLLVNGAQTYLPLIRK